MIQGDFKNKIRWLSLSFVFVTGLVYMLQPAAGASINN